MEPTVGRIVHYRLTREDASTANWMRVRAHEHLLEHRQSGVQWHEGHQVHRGDVVPLLIVSVTPWIFDPEKSVCRDYMPDVEPEWSFPLSHWAVSGQAFLQGNDTVHVVDAPEGVWNGAWSWTPRIEQDPAAERIAQWEDDGGVVPTGAPV